MEAPDRNLAMELVRVTEAAALASARWLGRGDKNSGDGAAVDAMRISFQTIPLKGVIVIGEGEKDEAPMLFNGEPVGDGRGPEMDVAVDPVEGTRLLAYGRPNAISVVGMAPKGTMFNPGPSYYMKKLVVPAEAKDVAELDAPVGDTLRKVAKALGKDVDDLVVFVLDKPRHLGLIDEITQGGRRQQAADRVFHCHALACAGMYDFALGVEVAVATQPSLFYHKRVSGPCSAAGQRPQDHRACRIEVHLGGAGQGRQAGRLKKRKRRGFAQKGDDVFDNHVSKCRAKRLARMA